uniref:Ig-like domain-containing protein n=1 Tax=Salmo trutta TaxID=8032 RepID=A0A674BFI1_SALTR
VGMDSLLRNVLNLSACCQDVITTEGEQVTLDCQFETQMDTNLNLFWYKQGAKTFPKYIFHADLDANSKSVPLTIQRVQLSDSAVYYCALKPTDNTKCSETRL